MSPLWTFLIIVVMWVLVYQMWRYDARHGLLGDTVHTALSSIVTLFIIFVTFVVLSTPVHSIVSCITMAQGEDIVIAQGGTVKAETWVPGYVGVQLVSFPDGDVRALVYRPHMNGSGRLCGAYEVSGHDLKEYMDKED